LSDLAILALGNPLRGDDGVGNAVLAELDRKYKLSPGVDLLYDCSSGDVLDALLGGRYRKAIVVDAAELGRRPGEWMLFNLQNAVLSGIDMAHCGSLHDASLAETLALGEALSMKMPEIVIAGVQPQELRWSTEISEDVRQSIPEVCTAIYQELSTN